MHGRFLVIDREKTGTPGAKCPRDKRRNLKKTLDGLQLITPLEDAEFHLDPERAPKYRVPKSAYTAPSEGSRRWHRRQQAGRIANKPSGEQLLQDQDVVSTDRRKPPCQGATLMMKISKTHLWKAIKKHVVTRRTSEEIRLKKLNKFLVI